MTTPRIRRWQLGLALAASAACSDSTGPANLGPPPGGGQQCRTYATRWISTSAFAPPDSTSAEYVVATNTYVQRSPAGSSHVVRQTLYNRPEDFIDETSVMGMTLFNRRESCATVACTGDLSEVPVYDRLRRWIGISLQANSTPLLIEHYTAWDNRGRPTSGTRAQPGICTIPIAITYDDAARTREVVPTETSTNTLCLGVMTSGKTTFDADGNVIRESGSAGGTSTQTINVITETARLCK